jgi:hypothetical protein
VVTWKHYWVASDKVAAQQLQLWTDIKSYVSSTSISVMRAGYSFIREFIEEFSVAHRG